MIKTGLTVRSVTPRLAMQKTGGVKRREKPGP
jgi:hypothetical protein